MAQVPSPSPTPAAALPKVFVALDMDETKVAPLIGALDGLDLGLKVGMELYYQSGPALVRDLARRFPVFLDLKLHDIPNTVQSAAARLADLGVRLTTVHAAGGASMLEPLAALERDDFRFLAVTVLTSMNDGDLRGLGVQDQSPADRVNRLFNLARSSGIGGFVCSPLEVKALHQQMPEGTFVTPGVRPLGSAADDQRRVATPAEALAAGATSLVIGRPITRSPDPRTAAEAILAELDHG